MNDFIMRKNKDIVLRICILHGIRPFFSFARQQVLLPRKAFWGIACALALRGDLCYPAREVIR